MKLVNLGGEVFKMSDRNYKRFLADASKDASGTTSKIASYGTYLGMIEIHCLDYSESNFKSCLEHPK